VFTLHLPGIARAETMETTAAPIPEPAELLIEPAPPARIDPDPLHGSQGTILLVDDEAGIRGLVRRILQREHYHVLEASSGEEALAIAARYGNPIQLAVTDVTMPGMNGPELVRSIRRPFPDIKVVFISGQTDTSDLTAFEGAALLRKPFTLTDLLRVVRGSLGPPGKARAQSSSGI
jgi:CheY-like chemotaxis protein